MDDQFRTFSEGKELHALKNVIYRGNQDVRFNQRFEQEYRVVQSSRFHTIGEVVEKVEKYIDSFKAIYDG